MDGALPQQAEGAGVAGRALRVTAAGRDVNLAMAGIVEIIRPCVLTRVPHAPPSLLGLANLRGAVLPVVSLAALLDGGAAADEAGGRIVVVDAGAPVGLAVQAVGAAAADAQILNIRALLDRQFAALTRRAGAAPAAPVLTPAPGIAPGIAPGPAGPASDAARAAVPLVRFHTCGQEYALRLADVSRVVAFTQVHAPATGGQGDPAWDGLATVDGALLRLVNLRALLGLGREGFDAAAARVLVTGLGGTRFGLVVDGVRSVARVHPDAMQAVPPILARGAGETRVEAICRVDGGARLVALLSPETLLDGEVTARLAASPALPAAPAPAAADGARMRIVVFQLGGVRYGLPVSAVDEVVRRPAALGAVPHAPDFLDGVMNLRGEAIPVIAQAARFGGPGGAAGASERVLIVTVDGNRAGFRVDCVREIIAVDAADMAPAPELGGAAPALVDRVAGVRQDGGMILLLNPATLLNQAARDLLSAFHGGKRAAL